MISLNDRQLLTLKEIAAEAHVSRRFLEMEIQRGRLRAIKLSGSICRVRRSDWETYLAQAATVQIQDYGITANHFTASSRVTSSR